MPGPITVPLATGQVWKFWIEGEETVSNQYINNNLFFALDDGGNPPINPAAPATFLDELRTRWRTNVLPLLGNTYFADRYNLACVTASNVDPAHPTRSNLQYGNRISFAGAGAPDQGTKNPPLNPAFVTISVRWRSAVVSRYTRSKLSLSPTADGDLNGDTWIPAYVAAVQAAAVAMILPYADAGNHANWTEVQFSTKLATGQITLPNYTQAVSYSYPILSPLVRTIAGSELHRKLKKLLT